MSQPTSETTAAPSPPPEKGTRISKIWVPVILAFAVLLGLALAETIPSFHPCPSGYSCPPPILYYISIRGALMLHVVLSTIELVLLGSLVVVYVKVYADTRANFSLGLIVVLLALTVHSFLSYPLVVNQTYLILYGSLFFPYTDLLTIVAYAVFLYLSLE